MTALLGKRILLLVPALLTAGLTLDQLGGAWGQPFVSVAIWLSFFWILHSVDAGNRTMMVLCLTYATAGEIMLSLVWHVYEYRLFNLPLFVPPGHVILFLLGLTIAPRISDTMVRVIAGMAGAVVAILALTGRDTFSALLVTVFLLSVVFGRERKLYAVMFVLALVLELYGTWLGNWHWRAQVGRTGMVTLNPPVAAGAFYCALDLLVMWTMRKIAKLRAPIVSVADAVQL